jgi:signal transduction histidine kinase
MTEGAGQTADARLRGGVRVASDAGPLPDDPVATWRQRAMNVWTIVFVCISALPAATATLSSTFTAGQRAVIALGWLLALAAAVLRRWPVWTRLLLWLADGYLTAAVGVLAGQGGLPLALSLTSGPIGVTVLWGAAPGLVVAGLNLVLFVGGVWGIELGWLPASLMVGGDPLIVSLRAVAEIIPKLLLLVWFAHFLTGVVRREADVSARLRTASARLERETAERLAAQRAALASAERERSRIGRDLHDGVCQDLSSLLLRCSVQQRSLARRGLPEADELDAVVDDIGGIMSDVRGLSRQLVPGQLDPADLGPAIEALAATAAGDGATVSARVPPTSPAIRGDAGLHLYRIAQEALHNALRHAAPRRVEIALEHGPEGATLRVDDDGCGLPAAGTGGGLGLRTMAWRAEMAGGTLTVGPRPGGGTRVECRLPARGEGRRATREEVTDG